MHKCGELSNKHGISKYLLPLNQKYVIKVIFMRESCNRTWRGRIFDTPVIYGPSNLYLRFNQISKNLITCRLVGLFVQFIYYQS